MNAALRIQVLGKGLIPRGIGLAPKKEPFPADLTLIQTIMETPGLTVNMIHPEDGHTIRLTRANLNKMWESYSKIPFKARKSAPEAPKQTSPVTPPEPPKPVTPEPQEKVEPKKQEESTKPAPSVTPVPPNGNNQKPWQNNKHQNNKPWNQQKNNTSNNTPVVKQEEQKEEVKEEPKADNTAPVAESTTNDTATSESSSDTTMKVITNPNQE